MELTRNEYARGKCQYVHAPQMLHLEVFPGDQDPTGQAVHTDDDGAATTEDMEPALQPVHVAAPPRAYDPCQHGLQSTLPSSGVWYPGEHDWHWYCPGVAVK